MFFHILAEYAAQILQGIEGLFRGVFAGGIALFVKIRTQHTKIAIIQVGVQVANLAVERLDHIHR